MEPAITEYGLLLKAIAFAADKHRDQRRKGGGVPYINHPVALADVLANEGGVTDVAVLCAAVLHDTIEDTETTAEELAQLFGQEITGIVLEVTDDKALPYLVRKQQQIEHAPHASAKAKLVKLADKICNLRDLVASPPPKWTVERRVQYVDWSAAVVAGLRGTHSELEAIFDGLVAQRERVLTQTT